MRRATIFVLAAALALPLAVAVGAAPLEPLVRGWEQFFKLDWEAVERGGRPLVRGHIANEWGMPAKDVRLLVDALDAGDRVTSQRVSWLGSILTPGTRAYFEVPMAERAPKYRVSVFAFDWVQSGNREER
ncbi:MAG TPA: hypothetical protein VFX28_16025 [Methylomirabilota bacterium]|nr:hypothetical protein [Methylomirabilota bacterium]